MEIENLDNVGIFDYDSFADTEHHDFHAVVTETLNAYIDDGLIDFESSDWDFDSFDSEQRSRLYRKVIGRFGYREIGLLPFRRWKDRFIATLNEIMPSLKPLYQAIADGYSPLDAGGEFFKSRDIHSDFPQTMLSGTNQDYASDGTDHEHERIFRGDFVEQSQRIATYYNDVDVIALNRLERLFSPLMTVNMNGF